VGSVDFLGAVDHAAVWKAEASGNLVLVIQDLAVSSALMLRLQLSFDDVLRI